jgi:hypothetical protein
MKKLVVFSVVASFLMVFAGSVFAYTVAPIQVQPISITVVAQAQRNQINDIWNQGQCAFNTYYCYVSNNHHNTDNTVAADACRNTLNGLLHVKLAAIQPYLFSVNYQRYNEVAALLLGLIAEIPNVH